MDQIEYQLLSRVAAGDGRLDIGRNEDPYLLGRLLQLRARGLVSFAGVREEEGIAGCRLTPEGAALLDSHRRVGGAGEVRAAGAARDPSPGG